jgi:hypothetical protein
MNKTEPQNKQALSVLSNHARSRAYLTKKNRRDSQNDRSQQAQNERSQRKSSIHSSLSGFLDDEPTFPELAIPEPGPGKKRYERRGAATKFSMDQIHPSPEPAASQELADESKKANRRYERRGSVTKYSLDMASSPENSEELQATTKSSFPSMPANSQPTIDQLPIPMKKTKPKKAEKKKKGRSSTIRAKTPEENEQPPAKPAPPSGRNQRRNSVTKYSESIFSSPYGSIKNHRAKIPEKREQPPAKPPPTPGRNQRRNSVTKYSESIISSPSGSILRKIQE